MWEGWTAPRPLIQANGQHLVFNEDTALLIQSITQPLVVVAIAGIYRTGKSYLMNRLAKRQSGFPLGNTLQSKTKGIWAWCLPHPSKPGYTLLLLDTEGLSDPEKSSEKEDIQLLCLAVLMSSLFAYNAIGKIDQEMINRLYFLTQVLESISVKASNSQDGNGSTYEELRHFLPDFVLVVRDFSLELVIDNKTVTPDEYFRHVLQPREEFLKYNRPRKAIQSAFRSHRCFVFARPVEDDDLFCKLESLKESDLTLKFLEQSNAFCQFVHSNAQAKKVKTSDGMELIGKVWLSLAREYTSTINKGAVPSIQTTFASVADRSNEQAVSQSVAVYQDYTKQFGLPVSDIAMRRANDVAYKRAVDSFMQQVIGDENRKYRTILYTRLRELFAELSSKNQQVSRNKCRSTLDYLYNITIGSRIANDYYLDTDGYDDYQSDLKTLQSSYNSYEGPHGCMHQTVLREYLREHDAERATIRIAAEEFDRKKRERIEQQRAAARAERRAQEKEERRERERREEKERLERERRAQEERERQQEAELRWIQEVNERRAREEHEMQMAEARRRLEEEQARRLQEAAEKQRQHQEAELARLRRLQQQTEWQRQQQDDSGINCCIL